ncbi:hypothetical protein WJX84_005769 [Apatococcus fuscideae]|uniref:KOW domain-containing protein n=1 Tax=Apatococcus fuscideae TaxID=2026836 RepID=A0AAW1TAE7_9CHLO
MGIPKKTIRPMFKKDKWKILRGDTVMITAGKDKGRTGTVSRVIRDSRKPLVIVEGLNLRKRFNKATQEQQGSMISVEGPVAYSSVQLIDPSTKLPIRVTWRYTQDGDKVRETRGQHATNSIIPRPDILAERRKPAPLPGARDTGLTEALRHTFAPGGGQTSPGGRVCMKNRQEQDGRVVSYTGSQSTDSESSTASNRKLKGAIADQTAAGKSEAAQPMAASPESSLEGVQPDSEYSFLLSDTEAIEGIDSDTIVAAVLRSQSDGNPAASISQGVALDLASLLKVACLVALAMAPSDAHLNAQFWA